MPLEPAHQNIDKICNDTSDNQRKGGSNKGYNEIGDNIPIVDTEIQQKNTNTDF